MTIKLSDKVIVDVFRRYEKEVFSTFMEVSHKRDYKEKDVDYSGILDEMFCQMVQDEFMERVIESIEDSISMKEYGFECPQED